jgi:glycine C-acetyltransferase
MTLHEQLERELAQFVSKEAAYLQTRLSRVYVYGDALVSKDDVIVYDADAHACIIDGVRLHQGKRFTYVHNDLDSIEKNLQRTKLAEETMEESLWISEGVLNAWKARKIERNCSS